MSGPAPGIGRMDEYLVHQDVQPIASVASGHSDWQDRFYFNIVDPEGRFAAITGLGSFPNRGIQQAYLLTVAGGAHTAYLNVRKLEGDREVMATGSLRYEVAAPLRSWRLEIADEANGVQGELTFHARCPAYVFRPIRWEEGGHTVVHQMHYTQAGRYAGELTAGGRTYSGLIGIRDRSWGIREMARVPMWIWIAAQFPRACVSAWLWETPAGDVIHEDGAVTYEDGRVRPIVGIKHELELHPGTRRPRAARFTLALEDGARLELAASEIASMFLIPPMTRWSEDDPESLARADATSFGFDEYCRFEMGGERGIGVVEYVFTGGVRKYGIPPVPRPDGA
jgi:hypothetical protein